MKLFWISVFLLCAGAQARLSRLPQVEMNQIKGFKETDSKVNLDEYWPFPKTISEADPFVSDLEKQLMIPNEES